LASTRISAGGRSTHRPGGAAFIRIRLQWCMEI
jgi:hypothetical protein